MWSGNGNKIVKKYKIMSKSQIPSVKEELKQKLQVRHKDCIDMKIDLNSFS